MPIVTTLNFKGQTEAALKLYGEALGAETMFLMRFRDSPDQSHVIPGMEDLVFHATFRIDETVIMASDVGVAEENTTPQFDGFALALRLDSPDRAREMFNALAEQGKVVIPLAEATFTSMYGIVVDRFGVCWKFNVGEAA